VSDLGEIILLVGRVLFAGLFLYSARGHLINGAMMVDYSRAAGMPFPALAAWPAAVWLAGGALSIALGVLPDVGALMLGFFVIPAAAYFHRFWALEDPQQRRTETMSFWRNTTLLGACLCLFAFFASAGHTLDLTLAGPAFDLR
jgi:putative oxidoreductase